MLHRALFGSLERFIGILLEHYSGALPLWLAPLQAVVLTISEHQTAYVQQVAQTLRTQGWRISADVRNEKIGYKIREHSLQKVPHLLVVGDQEMAAGEVSLRRRDGTNEGRVRLAELASSGKLPASR